tara:strand:+ start:25152 stop:25307 length:156 start_codon:yes stop_codon:yes gene_type:complete
LSNQKNCALIGKPYARQHPGTGCRCAKAVDRDGDITPWQPSTFPISGAHFY